MVTKFSFIGYAGECRSYSMRLHDDGTLFWKGRSPRCQQAGIAMLDRTATERWRHALEVNGFGALAARYCSEWAHVTSVYIESALPGLANKVTAQLAGRFCEPPGSVLKVVAFMTDAARAYGWTDEANDQSAEMVRLHHECGNGKCPAWTITILGSGHVVAEHPDGQVLFGRVPAQSARELVAGIVRDGFFEDVPSGRDCSFDLGSGAVLEVQVGGRLESLRLRECPAYPALGLKELVARVEAFLLAPPH